MKTYTGPPKISIKIDRERAKDYQVIAYIKCLSLTKPIYIIINGNSE